MKDHGLNGINLRPCLIVIKRITFLILSFTIQNSFIQMWNYEEKYTT